MRSALLSVAPHARGSRGRTSARSPVAIELSRTRHAAGEVISGRVHGAGRGPVVLVRLERRPGAQRAVVVCATLTDAADGSFALEVPASALPTVWGTRCSLSYVVRAGDRHAAAEADVQVASTARVHVEPRHEPLDRVLHSWPARHFHIELGDSTLTGGGLLTGRVHRRRGWDAGPIDVEVRCQEWWRSRFAFRGAPQWEAAVLWRRRSTLEIDPDAAWARFAFALPARLPPGVEARSIAWRYEVWATRARRVRDETAALTPLLFEDPGSIDGHLAGARRTP